MSSSGGLLGPAEVRALAAMIDVSPTKKLGQNFVHDPNTVRKIVRLAGIQKDDSVLEIGPGLGSLTLGILEAGAKVTAVEIDERLAKQLEATVSKKQPDVMKQTGSEKMANLYTINKDALKLSAEDLERSPLSPPDVLVANLPYNVSVPILMHLLELIPGLKKGLVMVQAEVGIRIAAKPGNKEYGAPSVKAAWYGEWEVASKVSRQIFWPVPGVDSVLVSFQQREESLGNENERELTFKLVNSAFGARRKMLRQSLQNVLGDAKKTLETLEKAGVEETARAENLSINDFHKIALAVQ